VVVSKSLTLIGNGSEETIIDGGGAGNVVTIKANWVNVSNFKIMNSGTRDFPYLDSGIKVRYVENITIKNNNLTQNYYGIQIENCKHVQVLQNFCFAISHIGIHGVYNNYGKFENNTCVYTLTGIMISGSKFNIISNNTCNSNKKYGINIFRSVNNIIKNNTCNNNYDGVYPREANSNKFENNYCSNNRLGFVGWNCQSLVIKNNIFIENQYGIELLSSNYNEIINNTCSKNTWAGIGVGKDPNSDIYPDHNKYIRNFCTQNKRGIELYESSFNEIISNNCSNNSELGINLLGWWVNNNTISNNICNYNELYDGIHLGGGDYNNVTNNICNSNGQAGIHLHYANFNNITKNICNSNIMEGLISVLSDSNVFKDNICINNSITQNLVYADMLIINSKFDALINNTFSYRGLNFISYELEHFNTHTIDTSNTVSGKPIIYWKNRVGGTVPLGSGKIFLANCTKVQVTNQTFTDLCSAIEIRFSKQCNVSNNYFSNNDHSIRLYYCEKTNITNNIFFMNNITDVTLSSSKNNLVKNNKFNYTKDSSLKIIDSDNNFIINNTISNNGISGISLSMSSENIICKNLISFNKEYGLSSNNSEHNRIYYNDFIENTIQAFEYGDGKNQWDNGFYEGNYWSDYNGTDNGANLRFRFDGKRWPCPQCH
jgi:parallel beta-helix repeat protein